MTTPTKHKDQKWATILREMVGLWRTPVHQIIIYEEVKSFYLHSYIRKYQHIAIPKCL